MITIYSRCHFHHSDMRGGENATFIFCIKHPLEEAKMSGKTDASHGEKVKSCEKLLKKRRNKKPHETSKAIAALSHPPHALEEREARDEVGFGQVQIYRSVNLVRAQLLAVREF